MCVLIAEILMLVSGLYTLIAGKVRLAKKQHLEGWRARVAGLFLVAPLPLALLIGFFLGLLIGMDILPASVQDYAGCLDLPLVVGGSVGAVISAWATKPKESWSPGDSQEP
jgi:hypothetical protein